MLRGDIVWADFEPTLGNEANKVRAAVVVSNDGANRRAETPRSRDRDRRPTHEQGLASASVPGLASCRRTGLRTPSKAQAEQIRAVAVERLGDRVGRVPPDLLAELDEAIRLHLAL